MPHYEPGKLYSLICVLQRDIRAEDRTAHSIPPGKPAEMMPSGITPEETRGSQTRSGW